ncbi:MAG TPA: hypothetical protein VF911_08050 [Thermoanaerobaculia bacterium]|jgi:hypothetical protein
MRTHSFVAFVCAVALAGVALLATLGGPERTPARVEQTQTVVETRRVTTQSARPESPIVPADLRSPRGLFSEAVPEVRERELEPAVEGEPRYVGNVNTHKFHERSCRYAGCTNCTAHFASRTEAVSEGFRPGGCCNP